MFAAFEFVFGNEDVVCKHLVVGQQECEMLLHVERTDEYLFVLFQNLDDLAFRLPVFPLGIYQYQHLVAVHGAERVAFGDEYRLVVVGNGVVLAVAAAFETGGNLCSPVFHLVFSRYDLDQEVLFGKPFEQEYDLLFLRHGGGFYAVGYLFIVEGTVLVLVEEIDDTGKHIAFFHPFLFGCRFTFCHNLFVLVL